MSTLLEILKARRAKGLPTWDDKANKPILDEPDYGFSDLFSEVPVQRAQPGWRAMEMSIWPDADVEMQTAAGPMTPRQMVEGSIGRPENPVATIGEVLKGSVKGGLTAAAAIPGIAALTKIPVVGNAAALGAAGYGGYKMIEDLEQRVVDGLAERASGGQFSDVFTPEYAGELAGGLAVGARYGKPLSDLGKRAGTAAGDVAHSLRPSVRQAVREATQRDVLEALAGKQKARDLEITHAVEHVVPEEARYKNFDAEVDDFGRQSLRRPPPFNPEQDTLRQADLLFGDRQMPKATAPENLDSGKDLRARLWQERQQILPRAEELGAALLDETGHLRGEIPSPAGEALNADILTPSTASTAWSAFQDQPHRLPGYGERPILDFEKKMGPSSPLIGAGKQIMDVLGINSRQPTAKQFSRGISPEESAARGLPYEGASYGPENRSPIGNYERGGFSRQPADVPISEDALAKAAIGKLMQQRAVEAPPVASQEVPMAMEQDSSVAPSLPVDLPIEASSRPPLTKEMPRQVESLTQPGVILPLRPVEYVDLASLKVSPKEYQYKSGGDARGVTGKLSGLKAKDFKPFVWEGSTLVVHERLNGDLFIADGHQRAPFGLMVEQATGEKLPTRAMVLRESEGWTVPEVRTQAAMKNIMEESGSPSDAAIVLKANPSASIQGSSSFLRQAIGLSKLGDEAMAAIRAGDIAENHASHIGNLFDAPEVQAKVVQELKRLFPKNDVEAVSMLNDIKTFGMKEADTQGQLGLPVFDAPTESLVKYRAKVLSAALGNTKAVASLMKRVNKGAGILQEKGNVVNIEGNEEAAAHARRLIERIQAEAGLTGPVSDALTQAAEWHRTGAKLSSVADRFTEAVLSLYSQPEP